MMFSSRTSWKLAANELTLRVEARRQAGLPILDLTESNPTRCGFDEFGDEILKPLAFHESLVYEPAPKGLLSARKSVSAYYEEKGVAVDPEQIILTASTSEAYSFLLRLLADPGERVLVPRPSYPLFDFLATLNDVQLDAYPLRYASGWHIDVESLRRTIRADTRAIILVNPNNPTGSFVKRGELYELAEICRLHDLALICDEVFVDYAFAPDPARPETLARVADVLTFTLSGISKLLGLPQMKLAWICVSGPDEQVSEALARLEVISDTYLSVNTPVQHALPRWMSLHQKITGQILARLVANREHLLDQVQRVNACQCLEAEGGWYAILRLPAGRAEEGFVIELLEKEGVLTHPGYFYDFEEGDHVVLSLLSPPSIFQDGINRLLSKM